MESFLETRGQRYRKEMSSPVTAFESCSRVSPYLSWGCLSVREVYQSARRELDALDEKKKVGVGWSGSLRSFVSRLSWHCHFMQKLEDEPELHEVSMCRAFDSLRQGSWDETKYEAWCEGRTGYPMVDACMRALRATGYLNFRMRAMVVSFASYHLWLDWRKTGQFLAKSFLDYEPGIHWCQMQMQSGTTGINTIRIYSPAKQLRDQDPEGEFVRKWVPELKQVPSAYLAEPHVMPEMEQVFSCCRIGEDYPLPIVDHGQASRRARQEVFRVKGMATTKEEAARVYRKHGSRKSRDKARSKT